MWSLRLLWVFLTGPVELLKLKWHSSLQACLIVATQLNKPECQAKKTPLSKIDSGDFFKRVGRQVKP